MTGIPIARRGSAIIGNLTTPKNKLIVNITLNNEQEDAFVPSFTTLDKIDGIVSIISPFDLNFEDVHITFQGTVRTYVEKVATSASTTGRTQAHHHFLRLFQPIDEAHIPEGRIAKAGQTYQFPFTFVVPERLLPQSCTHSRASQHVHDAHLQLPPSFGDPMLASDGQTLLDDLAPDMTCISYALRVVVTRKQPYEASRKNSVVADTLRKLRIIPAAEIQPPLNITDYKDADYTMRKEKHLKKGIFKGKLGRLAVEATQPNSLHLPSIRGSPRPVTTMAVINLRFDPAEDNLPPPRLGTLVNKLKVSTFFATVPIRDFPTKSNIWLFDTQRSLYVDTVPLSCRCVASATWTTHDSSIPLAEQPRRDSAASEFHNTVIPPSTSSPPTAKVFYTSQLLVPINLPTGKSFVPTFHSCLVSRVYTLDLSLSVHSPGPTVSATNLHLKLPLQISVEANAEARPIISEAEARAIAAREADHAIFPRNMAPPSPEYTERAELVRDYAGVSSGIERIGIMPLAIERRESLATTVGSGGNLSEGPGRNGSEGEVGDDGSPPGYSALGQGANARFTFGLERPPYGMRRVSLRAGARA
ncbi:MAG: hypothetical protein MMC33_000251 [Icmadophila ericetorum]|nr:hypothetical protein [Icmadophila ericetorum]